MITTLVLDTETGGLDCKTDALCSLSVSTLDRSYKKSWFIKPYSKNYSEKALEVNKLTIDFLEEKGMSFEDVKQEFIQFLNFIGKGYKIKLLGQNIVFDIGYIKELIGEQLFNKYFHYHFKDTMIIAEFLRDSGLIAPKSLLNLSSLHSLFCPESETGENAHSSVADVEMCIDVYNAMIKLVGGKQ